MKEHYWISYDENTNCRARYDLRAAIITLLSSQQVNKTILQILIIDSNLL